MKKIEYKTATVEQKVPYIERIICDRCKRVINKSFGIDFINETDKHHPVDMTSWYRVTNGHNDWGNDSCESVENFDICLKCITDVYDEYVERSHSIFNTEYIEIEHCYGTSLSLDEEVPYVEKELVVASASICDGRVFKNYMTKEEAVAIFGESCLEDRDDKKRD